MTLTLLRNGRMHTAADPDATALAISGSTISWIGGEHAVGAGRRPGPGDRSGRRAGRPRVRRRARAHHRRRAGAHRARSVRRHARWPSAWPRVARPRGRTPGRACCGGTAGRRPAGRRTAPPTRAEVDAAVGHRPAYLSRIDVHSALISSALAAERRRTAPRWPAGRTPGRSPSRPTPRSGPLPGNTLGRAAARRAAGVPAGGARRSGIVEVHECGAGDESGRADLAALLALRRRRSRCAATSPAAVTDPEQARQLLAETGAHALGGDLTVDGAIGSRTAALHRALHRRPRQSRRPVPDRQADRRSPGGLHARRRPGRLPRDRRRRGQPRSAGRCRRRPAGWASSATVRLAGCAHRVEHAEMADDERDRRVRRDRHGGQHAADVRRRLGRPGRAVRPPAGRRAGRAR